MLESWLIVSGVIVVFIAAADWIRFVSLLQSPSAALTSVLRVSSVSVRFSFCAIVVMYCLMFSCVSCL